MSDETRPGARSHGPPDHLRRLIEWDARANHALLESLEAAPSRSPRAVAEAAHLVAAEELWLARVKSDRAESEVWPDWELPATRSRAQSIARQWRSYAAALDAGELSRRVAYVNSLGESWTHPVEDIVLHVIAHSAYHRGQIALGFESHDDEPASDFARVVRPGLVE
jgi:uncharacterized damage-inducible protein DinB